MRCPCLKNLLELPTANVLCKFSRPFAIQPHPIFHVLPFTALYTFFHFLDLMKTSLTNFLLCSIGPYFYHDKCTIHTISHLAAQAPANPPHPTHIILDWELLQCRSPNIFTPIIQACMNAQHIVGAQLTVELQKMLRLLVKSHGRLKTNTSQVDYDLSNAWTLMTKKVKYNILKLKCSYPLRRDEMGMVTERVICLV